MHYRNSGNFSSSRFSSDSFTVAREANGGHVSRIIHYSSSSQVSVVSVPASEPRHPVFSRRHDVPGFTSLRQLVKPNTGVTIVNVYNKDNEKPKKHEKPRHKSQKSVKVIAPVFSPPKGTEIQKRSELQVEPTQSAFYEPEEPQHGCLATDEERRRVIKEPTNALPKWNQAEAAAAKHSMYIDDYDERKAQREWDNYYAGRQKTSGQTVNPKRSDILPQGSGEAAGNSERAVSLKSPKGHVSAPVAEGGQDHASGAFYGTTETERICMNAIQHVLMAEKELQMLQFTSDNVLPQTKQCLEKVRWVHECLKLFNTHFKDLQAETDECLQKKTGNHFTINMKAAPKNDLPFPAHM